MSNDSIIELQKLDCNCNDCAFMIRDMDRFNQSLELHKEWQLNEFTKEKEKINQKVNEAYRENELEIGYAMEQELNKMKFQFSKKECLIGFGKCTKLSKDVSFIPNTCQIDTQDCFQHRRQ